MKKMSSKTHISTLYSQESFYNNRYTIHLCKPSTIHDRAKPSFHKKNRNKIKFMKNTFTQLQDTHSSCISFNQKGKRKEFKIKEVIFIIYIVHTI